MKKIQDLLPGQKVTMQILWGNHSYELTTTVVGTNDTGVLLEPHMLNGTELDFSKGDFSDMDFHIHTVDPETNTRKAWKNVIVHSVKYNNAMYYTVSTLTSKILAEPSERRRHPRTSIWLEGMVFSGTKNENQYGCTVVDLSDNGVAITSKPAILSVGERTSVSFTDTIHGNEFFLTVPGYVARIADAPPRPKHMKLRKEQPAEPVLYGIAIDSTISRDLLMYIVVKRMQEKSTHRNQG